MKYLQGQRYRVIPVNPGIAGQMLLGETAYASLRDIPTPVDMVDVFRPARVARRSSTTRFAIGAKVVWSNSGSATTRRRLQAEKAGRGCHEPAARQIEFGGWAANCRGGHHSGIIRNRRRSLPIARHGKERPAPSHNIPTGRDPRHPPGATPRPGDRRALDTDLPDYLLWCLTMSTTRSLFNLHKFGYVYSRLSNPPSRFSRRVAKSRRRPGCRCRRSGHAAQFLIFFTLMEAATSHRFAQPLWRLADQFGLSFKKLAAMPFCRPDRPRISARRSPRAPRRFFLETRQILAASSSISSG